MCQVRLAHARPVDSRLDLDLVRVSRLGCTLGRVSASLSGARTCVAGALWHDAMMQRTKTLIAMTSQERSLQPVALAKDWQPDSWRSRQGLQMPTYPDADALSSTLAELSRLQIGRASCRERECPYV